MHVKLYPALRQDDPKGLGLWTLEKGVHTISISSPRNVSEVKWAALRLYHNGVTWMKKISRIIGRL